MSLVIEPRLKFSYICFSVQSNTHEQQHTTSSYYGCMLVINLKMYCAFEENKIF
jgi:hypothetical protein